MQLEDFEALSMKCKDPMVIAERHHVRSGLTHISEGMNGAGEAAIHDLVQRQISVEKALQDLKTQAAGGGSGRVSGVSADIATLQKQMTEMMLFKTQQSEVVSALQNKVLALESQLASRDAAAAAAAAAAAEALAAGAD
jgi:urease alpha subunit